MDRGYYLDWLLDGPPVFLFPLCCTVSADSGLVHLHQITDLSVHQSTDEELDPLQYLLSVKPLFCCSAEYKREGERKMRFRCSLFL